MLIPDPVWADPSGTALASLCFHPGCFLSKLPMEARCRSRGCGRRAVTGIYPGLPGSPRGDRTQVSPYEALPHGGSSSLAAQEPLLGTGGCGHSASCCMRLKLNCAFLFLCFPFLCSPGSSQGSEVSLGVTGSLVVHDTRGGVPIGQRMCLS